MPELDINSIPDRDLINRVISNLNYLNPRSRYTKPLWARVMRQFALGSTFARQLCIRHGFNPDSETSERPS